MSVKATGVFYILAGMNRHIWFTGGTVILLLLRTACIGGQVPAKDPHWDLIFEEHFDSLDPGTWKVAHHFDHYGEPQVYTNRPENVYLEEGKLVLQVREENYDCPDPGGKACNKSSYAYTSGWVETRQPPFGFLEARIRIPHGYGFWPAFWTFVGVEPPVRHNAAEIDIFEMSGAAPPTVMGTNMHLEYCRCEGNECPCEYLYQPRCPHKNPEILCNGLNVKVPDWDDVYHTYAVEWTPSKIIWYVNGQMVRNSHNPGIVDPVRVIFNLAITPWRLPDETTPFPSRMYIDYLKVYRLREDVAARISLGRSPEKPQPAGTGTPEADVSSSGVASTRPAGAVPDPSGAVSVPSGAVPDPSGAEPDPSGAVPDPSGAVSEMDTLSQIPVGTSVTYRATEEIDISGEFTVPLGAELYLDVNLPRSQRDQ